MSDIVIDTQSPFVHPRTGQEFPMLSFEEDLGKIGAVLKAQKIAEAQEFFRVRKDLAATMDWQRLLVDIETTPVLVQHIFDFIQTPPGCTKAIELSLAKTGKSAADVREMMKSYYPAERVHIATVVAASVERPVAPPRAQHPLSSGASAAPSPPSESVARKRKSRTGVVSAAA